ncbi:MAG: histidine kinase dimerization/phosphoacceptor domain -containing protein [Saprospiraceae bacterium]
MSKLSHHHIHTFLFFILLLGGPLTFAQYSRMGQLKNRLDESTPQSKERFDLTMELNELFAILPIGEDVSRQFIIDSLITYGEEALAWATEFGTPTQLANAQRLLVGFYSFTNQRKKFLQLAGEMVATNSFATREDKLQIYRLLAPIYLDIGYIEKFIELTEELSTIRKDLDEQESFIVNEHSHIAQAYFRLKDYKRARLHYRNALKVVEKGTNLLAVASISQNIGLTYAKEQNRDSAGLYFTRALTILETEGTTEHGFGSSAYNQHFKHIIKANLAMLEIHNGHYADAITAVEKELGSALTQHEHETIIKAHHTLGQLYYFKMNYHTALKHLDQALQKIRPQQDNSSLLENWSIRYKLLLASGRQQEGDRLYNQMMVLQDSIASVARDNIAMVASIVYETNKKEKALQEQKALLSLQQNEIAQSKQQQLTYTLGIAGMGLLLIVTYSFLQKVRTQKMKIEQQKQQLGKSLREKEILLKEVHHRVKNNLQVVSSILARQGQNSNDALVKKYMEEGQNRIRSMAMIHQQLYQTQDFENINLSEYTRLLLINISNYFSLEEQRIEVEMNVPMLPFPVDVAIPFGLILNELVSNSYKYGFAGKTRGKIKVEVKKMTKSLYQLSVSDDGNGLPEDMEKRSEKSLGINLVKGIAWQLRGKLNYYNTHPGSTFEVSFANDLKQVS